MGRLKRRSHISRSAYPGYEPYIVGFVKLCGNTHSALHLLSLSRTIIPGAKLSYDPEDVFSAVSDTSSYCYLPPEVLRKESYDEKVDVFGFGIILYELFMKRSLVAYFDGQNKNVSTAASEYARQVRGRAKGVWGVGTGRWLP